MGQSLARVQRSEKHSCVRRCRMCCVGFVAIGGPRLNLRKVNANGEDNRTGEAGEKHVASDGTRTWALRCCGHPMQAA
eukprot:1832139-Prymnesium_polylepis.1